MKSLLYSLCAGLLLGLLAPVASADSGKFVLDDGAKLFSESGRARAERVLSGFDSKPRTQLDVITIDKLPESKREEFNRIKEDKEKRAQFIQSWALAEVKAGGDKGVVVFIALEAKGLRVLADKDVRKRGFDAEDERKVAQIFTDALKSVDGKTGEDRTKALDEALGKAADYVVENVRVAQSKAAPANTKGQRVGNAAPDWTRYLCIGLAVVAGIWVITGLLRAFSGGGGGGGYGGGGGGGGGFMSSMLGGLFGAAAGMYLYNNFFGGNAYGGDQGYGGSGDNYSGDTGAGDFGGDTGAGGDFGGGGSGGGDYSGGGGDWGGGGGGDFGGGGGGGDW